MRKTTPQGKARESAWTPIYRLVRRIPGGRVMTYGQIAQHLEGRLTPRAVGWAMHDCPENVPWHRVVNASGGCSTDEVPGTPPGLQRALLEEEGVEFRPSGKLSLDRYRWTPPPPRKRPTRKARGRSGAARP